MLSPHHASQGREDLIAAARGSLRKPHGHRGCCASTSRRRHSRRCRARPRGSVG